ncbi:MULTISPECIES: DUF5710 domain-containing protein [unclassified Pseudomonas]|uniref:DUF5710 domain-containing protein n=1 Tax=unclassified Pseudomonas TaxID=196821 RepID=UPI000A1DDDED|nr:MULTISPECIES: DUF5710 domain-containing protein [unclassified Pseudomonas]
MARIDLKVPYAEKDQAKLLGARWDAQAKTWFVPEGVSTEAFARWLPRPEEPGLEHEPEFYLRSPYYFILQSSTECWKCYCPTRVFSFKLPEEHEQFEYAEEDEDTGFSLESGLGYWVSHGVRVGLSNISTLSPSVIKQLRTYSTRYQPDHSKMAGAIYYMNHCEHCSAKLGDFFMHSEPGGAFFPMSAQAASSMTLHLINERFDGNGSVGWATEDFMDCMRLKNG